VQPLGFASPIVLTRGWRLLHLPAAYSALQCQPLAVTIKTSAMSARRSRGTALTAGLPGRCAVRSAT
jgi:hypothetical protein